MNILILNWRDPRHPRSGGAEYVTHEHAKGWVHMGDRVTWFSSMFPGAEREEMLDGVHIVRQGNVISVFLFAMVYYFFHSKKYDVIIDEVHGIPFFTVLYARTPTILFLHEIAGVIWDAMYPFPISMVGKALESWYIRLYRNHRVWTDADSTVDELVHAGIPRDHCVAIPCPVATPPLSNRPTKNADLTCISVGRIVQMKKVEDILIAFADILKEYPAAELWIVGAGDASYLSMLRGLSVSLHISDHVVWYGRVSERKKMDLLGQAHFLLHTSVKEGWGLVVLEAASSWTPSIAYGAGGLTDTVKDGKTGVIVRTFLPSDIAKNVIRIYGNQRVYRRMQTDAHAWSGTLRWPDAIRLSHALLEKSLVYNNPHV